MTALTKKIYSAYEPHHQTSINFENSIDCCKQSFAEETDINSIMRRYAKTGIIESGNPQKPQYGVASVFDFQEAQNTVILAQTMFEQLPSKIRSFFDNEPEKMLEYMDNPANHAEAIKMGLLPTPEDLSGGTSPLESEGVSTQHKPSTKGAAAPSHQKPAEKPAE